jgi:hypothetical protein
MDAVRGDEQQTNRKKCDDQTEAHHKTVALQEAKREDDRGTRQHMSERHRQGNDDSEQKADCTNRRDCPIACEPAHARTCYQLEAMQAGPRPLDKRYEFGARYGFACEPRRQPDMTPPKHKLRRYHNERHPEHDRDAWQGNRQHQRYGEYEEQAADRTATYKVHDG